MVSIIALICLCAGTALAASDWKYEGPLGPEKWYMIEGKCDGSAQSPINIDTQRLVYNPFLAQDPFVFHGYDTAASQEIEMSNSGHSIQLLFTGTKRYLTGGNLPGRYDLLQIHFHWGSQSSVGSEHALNGQFFPLEMHMVHTNAKFDVDTALTSPNGLAVLGFFFEISPFDNPMMTELMKNFSAVEHKGGKTAIKSFPLEKLMSENRRHFYRYQGSLTTPGCYESVIWTVFNEPIPISERQMEMFRMIQEYAKQDGQTEPDYMANNYRPLQYLNGRLVFTTAEYQSQYNMVGGAGALHVSWLTVLLVFGVYLLSH